MQPGTKAGYLLKLIPGKTLHDADEAMKHISDEEVLKKLEELNKNSEVEDQCNNAVMLKSVLRTPALLTCLTFLFILLHDMKSSLEIKQ